jgi:hypothetical protein
MQSGSPEVQNIRRRSRFLNALSVKLRGSHAPLRRTTRSTAVPKNLSVNFVDNTERILSTSSRSSIKGNGPARRFESADQGSRIASTVYASLAAVGLAKAAPLQPSNEIFHSFTCPLSTFSDPTHCAAGSVSPARACPHGAVKRATGEIRRPAGASAENGDLAANDLAVWRVHKLPGERRCKSPEHSRRCCERVFYFS